MLLDAIALALGGGGGGGGLGDGLLVSHLLLSSVLPIVKVLIICSVGLVMALPSVNVFPGPARKSVSKLVFAVFLPAIIFVDLGEAINPKKIIAWWFIPVNVIIASIMGCCVGHVVAKLTNAPPEFYRLTYILTGIGNMGNMPLVLLTAVCSDAHNPFGPQCSKHGTAYIAVGMWMAAIIMWGVVYNILQPPELWIPGYVRPSTSGHVHFPDNVADGTKALPSEEECEGQGLLRRQQSFGDRVYGLTRRASSGIILHSRKAATFMTWLTKTLHIYDILRPPVLAAFLAMIFGLIKPLRFAFFDVDGPLRFISDSLDILGQAMIPCILIVLGGNLAGGPGSSSVPAGRTFAIVFARLFVMPAIGLIVVLTADKLGWIPPDNKLLRYILMLQHAMPSSIQIGNLRNFGEMEVSAVLFYEHLTAIFSMTAWLLVFIRFVLNAPPEELRSFERILFAVEQAHWFYEDNTREKTPLLKSFTLRDFTSLMFSSCAALRPYIAHIDNIYKDFNSYKTKVPTTGAIIVDDSFDWVHDLCPATVSVLLVKGWKSGSSWGFPKGKKNKDEEDGNCAVREVLEETGFDIGPLLTPSDFVEHNLGQQQRSRLYIVGGVDKQATMAPRTKKEISEIAWHRVEELEPWASGTAIESASFTQHRGRNGAKHFMVLPYLGPLRSWIAKNRPGWDPNVGPLGDKYKAGTILTVWKASSAELPLAASPPVMVGPGQGPTLQAPSTAGSKATSDAEAIPITASVLTGGGGIPSLRDFRFDHQRILRAMDAHWARTS
eukprot:SM000182S03949  [mRNA]  locus=s182:162279:171682:- [translate_table: standard]